MTRHPVQLAFLVIGIAIWFRQPECARADVISYLRFEEGSGFTASDQTGLMDGDMIQFSFPLEGWSSVVPASVIPLSGQPNNYSVRFGGGSEFIDLSNPNDVTLGTSFTVEFYFNAEDVVGGSLGFSLTPSSTLTWLLAENPETQELFYGLNLQGTTYLIPATGLVFGTWYHMAIVKEPTEFQMYLDGDLLTQQSVPASEDGPFYFPGTALTGDRTIGGDTGTWRGYLDEFRISDTALTPDGFLIAPEPSAFLLVLFGGLSLVAARRNNRA